MKAGRNDPCLCGSGKKFKKCCGLNKGQKPLKASVISGGLSGKMSSVFQKGISNSQSLETPKLSIKDKIFVSSQTIKTGH